MNAGVDVVDVPSFTRQLEDRASGFLAATFTAAERRTRDPRRLAARFAAKEAFLKAWSGSRYGSAPLLGVVDLREIEVVSDGYGRPGLALHGSVREAVGPHTTSVSLSHDGDVAIAVVMFAGRA